VGGDHCRDERQEACAVLPVDGEYLSGALRIGGPGAGDLFDEGFAGGGGEGATVGGIAVLKPAEQRHARTKASGRVGEAGPLRDDCDPAAVEKLLGGECQCAGTFDTFNRLLLAEEVVGLAGEARLAPGGFERRFAGGVFGKDVAGGACSGAGVAKKIVLQGGSHGLLGCVEMEKGGASGSALRAAD
jgi:hypothetical protein